MNDTPTSNVPAPIRQVREELVPLKAEFGMMLPSQITPEKFTEVVMTAVERDPALLDADRTSLLIAAKEAAIDGLLPDKKEGAFVVYNEKRKIPGKKDPARPNFKPLDVEVRIPVVKWMPMILGIRKKMFQTGKVLDITVELVHENDTYRRQAGDNGEIHHEPLDFGDRGKVKGGYAIIRTKEGGAFREVMSLEQIEAVAKVSKSDTVWGGAFRSEMMRKTILRRLAKQVPLSAEVDQVLSRDDALYSLPGNATIIPATLLPGGARHRVARQMTAADMLEDSAATIEPEEGESTLDATDEPAALDPELEADLSRQATDWVTKIRQAEEPEDLRDVVAQIEDDFEAQPYTEEQKAWVSEVTVSRMVEMEIMCAKGQTFLEAIEAWIEENPLTEAEEQDDDAPAASESEADDAGVGPESEGDVPDVPALRGIIGSTKGLQTWEEPNLWMSDLLNKFNVLKGPEAVKFWDANERFVLHAREAGHAAQANRILKVAADRGLYKPEA